MEQQDQAKLLAEFQRLQGKKTITTMPFGKHKGKVFAELPANYIAWVLQNLPDLRPELRDALKGEYARRPGSVKKKITHMPFGKYQGESLADLPSDYVNWLLSNCQLRPELRVALEELGY